MTSRLLYPTGIPLWSTLDNTNHRWMLLDPDYEPNIAHVFVDDVSANELTDGSYGRETLTGSSEVVDLVEGWVTYDADDPTWTALAGGEDIGYVAMFNLVTNDADSVMMYVTRLSFTTDGSNFTPIVSSNGIARFRSLAYCDGGQVT